ncbi:Sec-independent protein translocase protein TatB [Pseudooceanicola algae]|uniref:Sec-independent protein translocase protein TatB n=1 Tax=Pseudooceanicola algae TaxID=1537215 RepID=A0A418SF47_9RHOB|nr:Sec-independent protein translocase protein TatB [Pseudooceanicola algae]QPM89300.1 Sec-independent protein translocase protein TatB [Pseudooceanicola algae]
MFGMGWTEILVIGVVALVVVGPKELPGLFRNVGQFVGRARGMAKEFTRAMEEAADQSGMREASNTLKGLSNPKAFGLDKVREATDLTKWKPESSTGKLAAERAEASKKIQAAAAKAATNRIEGEKAAASAATTELHTPKISGPAPAVAPQVQPTPRSVNRPTKKREIQKGAAPRSARTRNAPIRKD